MNKSRFDKVGIKQVIRLEWMDRCLSLLLSGMSATEIRKDLIDYLADKKQSGGTGERGDKTYTIAIGILAGWFDPSPELIDLRDRLLLKAKKCSVDNWLPLHWAMMIAAYPFWFNVAIQTGRVLTLQEKVTQKQIFDRLVERYGERATVLRNARYAVRSFVAWGVLEDTEIKGRYKKSDPMAVSDPQIMAMLFEAMLISTPDNKAPLRSLMASPALFPMCLAMDVAQQAIASNPRLVSDHFGDGEMMVGLQNNS
ncbi:MAG: hypothetical protein WC944_01350 [Candidatus Cloacimonadaceae bacterium]|jgi:hypothetical protein|nr:hypothetical protein [Candidatus Cloacimonadota bacterium]